MNKFSKTLFMVLMLIIISATASAAKAPKSTHQYSAYSKDIGCDEWTDKRSSEICQSISDNLEWGWTGHAMIAPSWRVNWSSVKNVYCDVKISKADLPVLVKMCGSEIKPYMSCLGSGDPRLLSAVEYLIGTIRGQTEKTDEFKNTVYDPKNDQYLLKGGCKE